MRYYDKVGEKVLIDIMNRNAIISLAMICALWETNKQDLLDIIKPFVLYSVDKTATVGQAIDIDAVCSYMEKEFGYASFQRAVVERILSRQASDKIANSSRRITKRNHKFFLINSYDDEVVKFESKKAECKRKSNEVLNALAKYFNDSEVMRRSNYSVAEVEPYLLSFFEKRGCTILLSVDDFYQIERKNNEIDFFIGRFILKQYDEQTYIFDCIVELVKGYFVTTAIYLQADNKDISNSAFKDVTFYLDTRLLLAYLGYKSEPENSSVQQMVSSLKRSSAKVACFTYNIEEVNNILEAYKQSRLSKYKSPSSMTLEYFDEKGGSTSIVSIEQQTFEKKLLEGGIKIYTFEAAIDSAPNINSYIDERSLEAQILNIKPNYNITTLPDDLSAIQTIYRLRGRSKPTNIEKSKAIFVTNNRVLVLAARTYFANIGKDIGFPLCIACDDLCIIAWIKDSDYSDSLPKMRLLENVMAAINPSKDVMDTYFKVLKQCEQSGVIDSDEAALLRVTTFARQELMNLTNGNSNAISEKTIADIRDKMRGVDYKKGYNTAKEEDIELMSKRINETKNSICKQIEKTKEETFNKIEKFVVNAVRLFLFLIAIGFVVASIVSFVSEWPSSTKWALIIITVISLIEGVIPFFSRDCVVVRCVKKIIKVIKIRSIDKAKRNYTSIPEFKQ